MQIQQRLKNPMNQTQILKVKIYACPETHCRKKCSTLKNLNIHISIKHKLNYKIELDNQLMGIVRMG